MNRTDGTRLRAWIVPKVKAADIAREAGVSHQYVSSILNGKKPPSEKVIDAAKRLGVPVDAIFGGRP
jgi:transcriptional regulator with XRE-family HTH domain